MWVLALLAVLLANVGVVAIAMAVHAVPIRVTSAKSSETALASLFANPTWFIAGAVAAQVTVAFVLALSLWIKRRDLPAIIPLVRAPPLAFGAALLVVFGLAPIAQTVGELASRLLHVQPTSALLVAHVAQAAAPGVFVVLLACLSLLPGLIEETLFRGFITRAFSNRSFATQLLLPSLLFGIFHLEPTQSAATVVLGIGFALARLYTGSLLPGMLAHALYNATVLVLARLSPSADDHEIHAVPIAVGVVMAMAGIAGLRSAMRAPQPQPETGS